MPQGREGEDLHVGDLRLAQGVAEVLLAAGAAVIFLVAGLDTGGLQPRRIGDGVLVGAAALGAVLGSGRGQQLGDGVRLRGHAEIHPNADAGVLLGGEGDPVGDGAAGVVVRRHKDHRVHLGTLSGIAALDDLPGAVVGHHGAPYGGLVDVALLLGGLGVLLQQRRGIAAGIHQIRTAQGPGAGIQAVQGHVEVLGGALQPRDDAQTVSDVQHHVQIVVGGDGVIAGGRADLLGAADQGDQTGHQQLRQADPHGRLPGLSDLVQHPGEGETGQIGHGGDAGDLPGGGDAVGAVEGLQREPAQLLHVGDQQPQMVGGAGHKGVAGVHVGADVLVGPLPGDALGVQVAHDHPHGPRGAAVEAGVAEGGGDIQIQHGDHPVQIHTQGRTGGGHGAAEAPLAGDLAAGQLLQHHSPGDGVLQTAHVHQTETDDLLEVHDAEVQLHHLTGLDFLDALVGEGDVLGAQLAAVGVVRGEVEGHGQVLFIGNQGLGTHVVGELHQHPLDVLPAGLVGDVHGQAAVGVAGADEIVAVDEHAASDALDHAVAQRRVDRVDGLGLDVHAGDALQIAGVEPQRVEAGTAGAVGGEIQAAEGVPLGTVGQGVGVEHVREELILGGIGGRALGGGIDEQVQHIVLGGGLPGDGGIPALGVVCLEGVLVEGNVYGGDGVVVLHPVDLHVLDQILLPVPGGLVQQLLARGVLVVVLAVAVDIAGAGPLELIYGDIGDVPIGHHAAADLELGLHQGGDVVHVHEEVVGLAAPELVIR